MLSLSIESGNNSTWLNMCTCGSAWLQSLGMSHFSSYWYNFIDLGSDVYHTGIIKNIDLGSAEMVVAYTIYHVCVISSAP